jgi:hypothetical protein
MLVKAAAPTVPTLVAPVVRDVVNEVRAAAVTLPTVNAPVVPVAEIVASAVPLTAPVFKAAASVANVSDVKAEPPAKEPRATAFVASPSIVKLATFANVVEAFVTAADESSKS